MSAKLGGGTEVFTTQLISPADVCDAIEGDSQVGYPTVPLQTFAQASTNLGQFSPSLAFNESGADDAGLYQRGTPSTRRGRPCSHGGIPARSRAPVFPLSSGQLHSTKHYSPISHSSLTRIRPLHHRLCWC